jgi:uncharacterized DUF497 family protein
VQIHWIPSASSAVSTAFSRISFPEAVSAFDDPHGFEAFDDREDYGEDRWVWFGRLAGRMLIIAIAFTERGDRIRIISARPAESDEESAYLETFPTE